MGTRAALLKDIEAYCAKHQIAEPRFGFDAVGDHRFVERLREGKATLRLMERAEAYLAAPREKQAA